MFQLPSTMIYGFRVFRTPPFCSGVRGVDVDVQCFSLEIRHGVILFKKFSGICPSLTNMVGESFAMKHIGVDGKLFLGEKYCVEIRSYDYQELEDDGILDKLDPMKFDIFKTLVTPSRQLSRSIKGRVFKLLSLFGLKCNQRTIPTASSLPPEPTPTHQVELDFLEGADLLDLLPCTVMCFQILFIQSLHPLSSSQSACSALSKSLAVKALLVRGVRRSSKVVVGRFVQLLKILSKECQVLSYPYPSELVRIMSFSETDQIEE
ncbi:hypothetical protein Tco_0173859 [Tanacetum coccineum]